MKTALVHEWLTPQATGGSELVVQEILKHVDGDLYALIDFESTNPDSYLFEREIGTTFLQHLPFIEQGLQNYFPLFAIAIEQLNLQEYDLILSSSHAVAKGVLANPQQLHICYCHTPMRYAWDLTFDYLAGGLGKGFKGLAVRYLFHQLRQWDVISANRVDYFIANSHHTARRIWRCYRRPSQVIYPPVNLERFQTSSHREDFYLTVSRLVSYKKVALIVEAFNELQLPLVVIGEGSEMNALRQIAQPNIQLLGRQSDSVVEDYLAKAKAFVYAACEDFGIAPVEAQACGTPVIAYGAGGALETVVDKQQFPDSGTGLFFSAQTTPALVNIIKTFTEIQGEFEVEVCQSQAAKFSSEVFKSKYLEFLDQCWLDFHKDKLTRDLAAQ